MDFEMDVYILNRSWKVKGLTAIKELAEWLDEHASENSYNEGGAIPCPEPLATGEPVLANAIEGVTA